MVMFMQKIVSKKLFFINCILFTKTFDNVLTKYLGIILGIVFMLFCYWLKMLRGGKITYTFFNSNMYP